MLPPDVASHTPNCRLNCSQRGSRHARNDVRVCSQLRQSKTCTITGHSAHIETRSRPLGHPKTPYPVHNPAQSKVLLCACVCLFSGEESLSAPISSTGGTRRLLRIQHDSCYGAEGAFATETFENIGTAAICDGLCKMNSEMCISRAYMVGTKTCFLKIACQNQLGDTTFIPLSAYASPCPHDESTLACTSGTTLGREGFKPSSSFQVG